MQIPNDETGLPLVEAVHKATGYRPHLSTALRWCQRPNRYGIRLESWRLGGRRVTSVEAVRRFNQATTAAADRAAMPTATSAQVGKAHRDAVAALDTELGTAK